MKIQKIIIGVLIILVLGACILLALDKRKYVSENNKLKNENSKLQEQLNKENSNISNDKKEEINTCTYTKTYRFIEYYDFQGEVPTAKFIVVDQFQIHSPIIIEYNSSNFNIDFEKNSYYEFTFTSLVNDYGESKKNVTNIVKTDKTGIDQINESCKVR